VRTGYGKMIRAKSEDIGWLATVLTLLTAPGKGDACLLRLVEAGGLL